MATIRRLQMSLLTGFKRHVLYRRKGRSSRKRTNNWLIFIGRRSEGIKLRFPTEVKTMKGERVQLCLGQEKGQGSYRSVTRKGWRNER